MGRAEGASQAGTLPPRGTGRRACAAGAAAAAARHLLQHSLSAHTVVQCLQHVALHVYDEEDMDQMVISRARSSVAQRWSDLPLTGPHPDIHRRNPESCDAGSVLAREPRADGTQEP